MTPRELREITETAIKKWQEEHQEDDRRKQAETECREQMQQHKASIIINQIPVRAAVEARAKRFHAILMSVDTNERGRDLLMDDHWRCDVTTLTGTAKIVYEHCKEKGFSPTLEFRHDGVGYNSGYNIVIHW